MKKIKDLEPQDFPDVNVEKFHEWKNALIKRRKISDYISYPGLLFLVIFIITKEPIASILFAIVVIVLLAYLIPSTIKVNKLRKELGISSKDFREVLKDKK